MKKALRLKIFKKYDGHCAYCGKNMEYKDMQVDHYYPKRNSYQAKRLLGVDVDNIKNLMPSCRRCNHYKRSYQPKDFKKLMQTLHERIVKTYLAKVAIDYGIIKILPFDGQFYYEKLKG